MTGAAGTPSGRSTGPRPAASPPRPDLDTFAALLTRELELPGGALATSRRYAEPIAAIGQLRGAIVTLATDALIAVGADGHLDAEATTTVVESVAAATETEPEAVRFLLYARFASSPALRELPPAVAAQLVLDLLVDLGVLSEVSLFRRGIGGAVETVAHAGGDGPSRRARGEARAVLQRRSVLRLLGRTPLRSVPVLRFGQPYGALVGRVPDGATTVAEAFLGEGASALRGVLEREHLLERSGTRERALVSVAERRLMRLGFDLHDGAIQDVLALAADVRHLRDQVYPFILETHRERAYGRFDDLLGRLGELDRRLREVAHSLESKSIVSRPIGEVLHREVDAFRERSGIDATLEVRGDPETLSSAQRIAVFRAIQEALANVREHSGATEVDIRLRTRRASLDVRITDNGDGFDVSRALARAAQRGRLGLVGIGERVRMLGGTFDVESRLGGPTVLSFSLPRWEPLAPPPEH